MVYSTSQLNRHVYMPIWDINLYLFPLQDIGPKIQYYLLCDNLPEDRKLREELQNDRLVCFAEQNNSEA